MLQVTVLMRLHNTRFRQNPRHIPSARENSQKILASQNKDKSIRGGGSATLVRKTKWCEDR